MVMAPVLKEANGLWSHLPVIGIWQASPLVDVPPDLVDVGRCIVLLLIVGELIKPETLLIG